MTRTRLITRGRSPYGLHTPRDDEPRRLCGLANAHWFDVIATSGHGTRLTADNLAARRLCWTPCPARELCLAEHTARPARDRANQLAGGHVFDNRGEMVP